jgi:hypothetical protein
MKHATVEELRESLFDIHRNARAELANLPLSAAWPIVSKLLEANTYANAERRGDAIERAVDDLTRLIGEARQRIHACNARIEAEEEREAAEVEARTRVALGGVTMHLRADRDLLRGSGVTSQPAELTVTNLG